MSGHFCFFNYQRKIYNHQSKLHYICTKNKPLVYHNFIGFLKQCSLCGYAVFSECRFSVPAPEYHRSVILLAPVEEVVAESYPIRTVIQLSGRLFVHLLINWEISCCLNEVNFCILSANDKKSRYTAHQINGRKSLAISLMKLCIGSEIQKPSMSAFSVPQADTALERRSRNLFRRLPCVSLRYSIVAL